MNRLIIFSSCILLIIFMIAEPVFSGLRAYVESVRKDGTITISFPEKPEKEIYFARLYPGLSFRIISLSRNGDGFRAVAVVQSSSGESLRSGIEIDLGDVSAALPLIQKPVKKSDDVRPLKKSIVSETDKREMILIPSSFFYFGSDDGLKDESPKVPVHLYSYYIDKYEVSIADYLLFADISHASYPKSWGGIKPPQGEYDFPVIVSYTEAEKYAQWAGKRIPTEEEWEKSASGSAFLEQINGPNGYREILKQTNFSWGDYSPNKSNCFDYWEVRRAQVKNIKSGFLSVKEPLGISAFGLFNIAGNAPEWTSTWYDSRPGNNTTHFRYGKQVKVIKGGAWYSKKQSLRIQHREYGGIPNLESDSIAGFRCVKDPVDDNYSD
jgi:formylglycine-generating enzyme required for sulfatase activity